jgi:hypothetical protein
MATTNPLHEYYQVQHLNQRRLSDTHTHTLSLSLCTHTVECQRDQSVGINSNIKKCSTSKFALIDTLIVPTRSKTVIGSNRHDLNERVGFVARSEREVERPLGDATYLTDPRQMCFDQCTNGRQVSHPHCLHQKQVLFASNGNNVCSLFRVESECLLTQHRATCLQTDSCMLLVLAVR